MKNIPSKYNPPSTVNWGTDISKRNTKELVYGAQCQYTKKAANENAKAKDTYV